MANSLYGADSPWAVDTDLLPPRLPVRRLCVPQALPLDSDLLRRCPHPSNHVLAQRWRPGFISACPHCAPADTTLGVFEIPPEVYDDPLAHLVLEGMLKSVAAHRTAGIMSHVATRSVGGIDYLVNHFDLVALPERIPIRQVAARWVKQCLYCAALAHPGPAGCAAHWPPPTIHIQTGLYPSCELASRLPNTFTELWRKVALPFHHFLHNSVRSLSIGFRSSSVEGDSGSGTTVGSIEGLPWTWLFHARGFSQSSRGR
ncbi:hypothetical protein FB451DRAFT_1284366 [Mycena latifolia]|nr:hypothetical protein FB451DRAFT_1284366 [Mycena latifolia]